MEFTAIPQIKQRVSRIGLGSWSMGGSLWGGSDEQQAIRTIRKALDKGINFIDTAPAYGKGASEKIVGKALKEYGKRDQVIIATKCGLNQETEKVFRDSRKKSLLKEVEDSLSRLQVDYIDLYQVHWPDAHTPISETAETLKGLLEQGKIRAIGVSNFSIEQMNEFRQCAPLHTSQPPFNLFERGAETTILPYSHKEGLAVVAYSALCRGLLTDKMNRNRKFEGDDLRKNMDPKFQEPHFSEYLDCIEALKKWAQDKHRCTLVSLAVRWVLDKGIDVTLWGARKPEQLDEIDRVLGWKLNHQDFDEIDSIIDEKVKHPIGPDFMSPPERDEATS